MKESEREEFFVELYEKKQGLVRQAVKSGLGDLAKSQKEFMGDVEALSQDAWIEIYKALLRFERRSDQELNAWLRLISHRVGSEARKKYFWRLKQVSEFKADLIPNMRHSYALTQDDLNETATQKYENAGDDDGS